MGSIPPPEPNILTLFLLLGSGARAYKKTRTCHSCYAVPVGRKGDCFSVHEVSLARKVTYLLQSVGHTAERAETLGARTQCFRPPILSEITFSTTTRLHYRPQTPTNFLADSLLLLHE